WMNTLDAWQNGQTGSVPWIRHTGVFLAQTLGLKSEIIRAHFVGRVNMLLTKVSSLASDLLDHLISFILNMLIMLFSLFFLLRDGERSLDYFRSVVPIRH